MKKVITAVLLAISLAFLFSFFAFFIQPGQNPIYREVEIQKGLSAKNAISFLREKNIIRSRKIFKTALYLLGLESKIQAGRYGFYPYENNLSLIYKLVCGKTLPPKPFRIVFPEGTSVYKMGTILDKSGLKISEDFKKLSERKGPKNNSLEGFLFPDTYVIDGQTSAEALVSMMLKRFESVILPYWESNKKQAKLSFYDTLILASIIEKEAKIPKERPLISSVFFNRLKMGMPLAADPTIKYALERPTKKVYLNQLKIASPYNSYRNKGLPPTPICNPGLESFKAAIYPEKTNFIYFVAQKDGSHIFSDSWEGHQKARRKAVLTPTR